MGCKPTSCRVCGGSFPACQIVNGVCASCRTKETKEQQQKQADERNKKVIVP